MKTKIFSSVVAFSVLFCGAAQASETIEVGLGATTLGTTVEGRYIVSDNFALRGIYALGLEHVHFNWFHIQQRQRSCSIRPV